MTCVSQQNYMGKDPSLWELKTFQRTAHGACGFTTTTPFVPSKIGDGCDRKNAKEFSL